jgi:NAD(P)-dependent dehydrogenase (short-subunit alcohol dehydrogenase family)
MEHEGKAVLVTGAQQGIGRSMALAFAKSGADVAINWHDDHEKAQSVADEVKVFGNKVIIVKGDVSVVADTRRIIMETVSSLGKIDILINNAGMFPRVAFLEMEEQDWDFVLDINLKGTFFCSQAAARAMVQTGNAGCIINLSSQAVSGNSPLGVHYCSSKSGIIGLTRASALELAAHNIRVNAIAPGLTDTAQPRYGSSEVELVERAGQSPSGRMVKPEEIANMAVFLCSEKAAMVTGQVYHVNGGTYFP